MMVCVPHEFKIDKRTLVIDHRAGSGSTNFYFANCFALLEEMHVLLISVLNKPVSDYRLWVVNGTRRSVLV